ncbi:hypothetical protein ACFQ61_17740 [Streptomyces sp. NPDC056500]|uniref:hypothetical protein n=1 Tax=Streptomyces sp. NPDC056500 TaxID=3345840 RepID=UPI00368570CB
MLGNFATPYAPRAIRWLCVQAVRIANGLDPDPDVPWSAALLCVTPDPHLSLDLTDAPTALRTWVGDDQARRAAFERLRAGLPFMFAVTDWSGRYVLAVWPVVIPPRVHAPHTRAEAADGSTRRGTGSLW